MHVASVTKGRAVVGSSKIIMFGSSMMISSSVNCAEAAGTSISTGMALGKGAMTSMEGKRAALARKGSCAISTSEVAFDKRCLSALRTNACGLAITCRPRNIARCGNNSGPTSDRVTMGIDYRATGMGVANALSGRCSKRPTSLTCAAGDGTGIGIRCGMGKA